MSGVLCERVYQSCKYAIGRSRFFWPPELECNKFSNDATCYNLTKGSEANEDSEFLDEKPLSRRRRAISTECKPTPSTPICSLIEKTLDGGPLEYFQTTFQNGNYFNHSSTDETVYELSKYLNLISSLRGPDALNNENYENCFSSLILLLCHLHLPVCPRSPMSQTATCLQVISNTSFCFNAVKDLNTKGANFTWPPVNVNCQDAKWFTNETKSFLIRRFNPFGPPAPKNIQITPQFSTRLNISFDRTGDLNTTALYRRRGTTTAYQCTTTHTSPRPDALTLEQLTPATDYEIKLASLRSTSGCLPGAFVGSTSNTFGKCQNDTTGEEITQGKFFWTTQDGNQWQNINCPYGKLDDIDDRSTDEETTAKRFCACDIPNVCKNPSWLEPNTSTCNFKRVNDKLTSTLSKVLRKLDSDKISRHNASEELVSFTSIHAREFTANDVILSTLILENIVNDTQQLNKDLDIDVKTQNQRISFAVYRKTSLFTTSDKKAPNFQTNTVRRKNSFVISGSVKGQKLTNLTDPIKTTYQPLDAGIDETTACVFWNFTAGKSGLGNWSSVGCSYQGIADGVVTCHCTHLTNFAILMDVHIDDRDETHDKVLSVISYIGCAISLVGLVLTIITMLIFKDLRSKVPTQILLNFCIALSLTLIVFLVAAERSNTSSFAGCRAAAIALHYFVLAMFVWTSIQAYNMYLALVSICQDIIPSLY